jgi:uncharacterized membrane protein
MEISELDSTAMGTFSLCVAGTVVGGVVATYCLLDLHRRSQLSQSQSKIGKVASMVALIASGMVTTVCSIAALGSITARIDSSSQNGESYWKNFKIHYANWSDVFNTASICILKCIDCAEKCFKRTS